MKRKRDGGQNEEEQPPKKIQKIVEQTVLVISDDESPEKGKKNRQGGQYPFLTLAGTSTLNSISPKKPFLKMQVKPNSRNRLEDRFANKKKEPIRRLGGPYSKEELVVTVDKDLVNSVGGPDIFGALGKEFWNVSQARNKVNQSVEWGRRLPAKFVQTAQKQGSQLDEEDEKFLILPIESHMCIRLMGNQFVELMMKGQLEKYLDAIIEITKEKEVIIVLEGLDSYLELQKNYRFSEMKKKRFDMIPPDIMKYGDADIERTIIHLEVSKKRIRFYRSKNAKETAVIIVELSKQIIQSFSTSAIPHNLHKNSLRKVETPREAFKAWLCEIPNLSENMARAITGEYPSLKSLMAKYKSISLNEEEKKELLVGLESGNVKIGKSTSLRVYQMFALD